VIVENNEIAREYYLNKLRGIVEGINDNISE
jgi:hypothetical protein